MKKKYHSLLYFMLVLVITACAVQQQQPTTVADNIAFDSTRAPEQEERIQYKLDQRNYKFSETLTFDLIHTWLELEPDFSSQTLKGKANIEVKPYAYPQEVLQLDAVGFQVSRVASITGLDTLDLNYDYDSLKLDVYFEEELLPGESAHVYIEYLAQPELLVVNTGEAIQSDKGLFFINANQEVVNKPTQLWTQSEPQSASKWFPTLDAPNQRGTQETFLIVDTAFATLSNGVRVFTKENGDGTKTDYWKMKKPHAPYLHMIAVGNYAVVQDQWKDVPLYYFVEPEYAPYAKAIFGNTPEMMSLFSEITGVSYPWDKYAQIVVRDYVSGAMENTTASVFLEDLQMNDRELIDISWDNIIAHELFHHWFGNLVTCESWSNLVLNEGFATYGEYLWNEYKTGRDEADFWWMNEMESYLDEFEETPKSIVRYEYEEIDALFDQHSYAKGGLVIHMLRNYLGDEAFFKSLNIYLKSNQFSAVELSDLRQAFEEASGQDLKWFFDQWFSSSGHPILEVDHKFDSSLLVISITQTQDLTEYPLFRLPMFIDVWVGEEKMRFPVTIENEVEVFELEMETEPSLVLVDAENQLVGEIFHPKTASELQFQYYRSESMVSRMESVDYFSGDLSDTLSLQLLLDAFNDPFWAIRELAVTSFFDYQGNSDLIEERLTDLIKNDPKSDVRGTAISVLASIDHENYGDLFRQSLQDSSYYVSSEALIAYLSDTTHEDNDELIAKYESENVDYYTFKLAEYYAETRRLEKYDWFLELLDVKEGIELWSIIYYFNQLNLYATNDLLAQSLEPLRQIAIENETYYIRLAATQGLVLMEDMIGVSDVLQEIKAKETDPALLEIYDQLF
jgi:aminopeptidase N